MAEWTYGRLYAIADVEVLARKGVGLREFAEALRGAGVRVVQLRDKVGEPQDVLAGAAVLREVFEEDRGESRLRPDEVGPKMGHRVLLVMNDRVDLALIAGFGGVHVGQEDMGVEDVRRVVREGFVVGVSTHDEEQARVAEVSAADYVAIGPVFATGTKADAAEVVGLEGVRRARALTTKPLVAIGGITRENCRSVVEAGADAVAVISGMFGEGETVEEVAREWVRLLSEAGLRGGRVQS